MTEAHVDAVRRWSREHGTALSTLDVVGFHGQTITHRPEKRFTWQIGDGAALARALGVRVVNDLRGADVRRAGRARRWCRSIMPPSCAICRGRSR